MKAKKYILSLLCSFLPILWAIPVYPVSLIKRNPDPVFSTGKPHPWDREEVEVSSILFENGKYKMWYTGFDGTTYRIGLAESGDGKVWKKHPDFVLGPEFKEKTDSMGFGQPCVIRDGDLYKMWFVMSDKEESLIGYATSRDGIHWQRHSVSVLYPANFYWWNVRELYYPCVIKEGDTYRMWFVGYDGLYSIGVAASKDGIKWELEKDGPVFSRQYPAGARDQGLSHPYVLKNPSGSYEMWYSEMKNDTWVKGRAFSRDGVRWEVSGKNHEMASTRGAWDSVSAYRPVVLLKDKKYTMWYSGSDGYRVRVGTSYSSDGNNWTKDPANPVMDVSEGKAWENASLNGGTLLKHGDQFKMWYAGYNGSRIRIGYAVSDDGIHWDKNHDNPALDTGKAGEWDRMGVAYPSVVIGEDGRYRMWYVGFDGGKSAMGAAVSGDGIHWEKSGNNPVLLPGKKGEWDEKGFESVTVLREGEGYRMWYSATDGRVSKIGMAVSPDGIHWEKWKGNPVLTGTGEGKNTSVSFPCVIREEGKFRLWYAALESDLYSIHEAESTDGIHWLNRGKGKPVLKADRSGGILEVKGPMVCKDGNRYLMAYEALGNHTNLIALATSEDGTQWLPFTESYLLDIGIGDGWDAYGVSGGWVLKDPSSKNYKMWYSGHDGVTFRIGLAVSKDGLRWERDEKNPVLDVGPLGTWDSQRVTYPSVIYDQGVYKMWYHGFGSQTRPGIGYAVSKDGVRWKKHKGASVLPPSGMKRWDSFAVGYPCVMKDGETYKMWYAGLDRNYGVWRIGYAESEDGLQWEKHGQGPVLNAGTEEAWDREAVSYPMVIKTEHGFTMFFVGYRNQAFRVGVATSKDGITWQKAENNPLVDIGKEGAFDEGSALAPMVIREGNRYRIWYTGIKQGLYQIGYAEAMEGEMMARKIIPGLKK